MIESFSDIIGIFGAAFDPSAGIGITIIMGMVLLGCIGLLGVIAGGLGRLILDGLGAAGAVVASIPMPAALGIPAIAVIWWTLDKIATAWGIFDFLGRIFGG